MSSLCEHAVVAAATAPSSSSSTATVTGGCDNSSDKIDGVDAPRTHVATSHAATLHVATSHATTTVPHVLGEATLEAVARYIVERDVRRVLVLLGAGASVAAGIPDFRSPGTGIYAQLAHYGLDDPSDAFALTLLRARPEVFYRVAREMRLWPGTYTPTAVHHFVRLLADSGRLLRCCTQNIDGLERAAGVPPSLLVEAHGSFATAACVECEAPYDVERNRDDALLHHRVSRCARCGGVVKPGIVFFGESLPERFWSVLQHDTRVAELVLIIGTSLQVHPFAALPLRVGPAVPRVVLNMQRVGGRMFRFVDDPPELFAADATPSSSRMATSDDDEDDDVDGEAGVLYAATPHDTDDADAANAAQNSMHNDSNDNNNNDDDNNNNDDDNSSSSTASSSDGYAQYGDYDDHPPLCRDVLVTGDCQASVQRLAQLLGLGERLDDAIAAHTRA